MKWSFATVGIILLGIIGVSIILLFQQITTNNENDYYLLKEVTEAAMIDAIDLGYYRETGNLKIIKEKFVENFTRRFAESTIFVTNDYEIKFYDIIEDPPKVSIIIDTGLGSYTVGGTADDYGIANKLDAILEITGKDTYTSVSRVPDPYVQQEAHKETYYLLLDSADIVLEKDKIFSLKTPDELIAPHIKDVKIENVSDAAVVDGQGELNQALMRGELTYNNLGDKYKLSFNTVYNSDIHYSSSYNGKLIGKTIDHYNCGERTTEYTCDGNNKYYIKVNGNVDGKVILKYEVTWSYKEYELSN